MPIYNKVPPALQGRRFDLIYISLTSIRAREIIEIVGSRQCNTCGEDNAFLQELAGIIDAALRKELERQRGKNDKAQP